MPWMSPTVQPGASVWRWPSASAWRSSGPLTQLLTTFCDPSLPQPRHIGSPDNALGPLLVDKGRLPQGRLSPPPHQQTAFLPQWIPLTPCYHRAISNAVVFQVFKLRAGKMPLCVWLSFLSTSLLAFPTTGNCKGLSRFALVPCKRLTASWTHLKCSGGRDSFFKSQVYMPQP